ncbi:MAG TPA: hypothetical protein DEP35_08225 [Deltaproteobacteria bacterium]|jgi:hypothetical protein|nr:hypothetical protein [Deltaproteobacteria bacterium]
MGITDTLDSVSGALAGAEKPAAPPPATLCFFKGTPIGLAEGASSQAAQPHDGNVRDTAYPTEFIHLGYVHPDYSNRYEGHVKDDLAYDASKETALHGAMQRAALQREALLLAGFVAALQETLDERQKGKGKTGVGAIVGAAADILGGQGGKQTEPTPGDCNPFGQAIQQAADKVKGPKVSYKDMHQAGIDLRQARLDYAQYLKKLNDGPPKDQGPAGLLSGVSAVAGSLPGGLGQAVTIVQGIAFKPFDVYLGIFTGIAGALEPKVMAACHRLSIDAIQKRWTPLFAPWYQAPPGGGDSGAPSLATNTGVSPLDSATHSADGAYKDVRDFLADTRGPARQTEGYLNQAFVIEPAPEPKKGEPKKPAKFLADLITTSFCKALGVDPLPGILDTLISEICAIDAEFLLAMYQALLKRDPSQPIDVEELKVSARKRLLDKLVNLLVSQVSFLQQVREFAFAPKMNDQKVVNLSPGNFEDRGENLLNEQFGKYLDPALDFAMSDVWKKLEGGRKQAYEQSSMTMEIYLGMLPWMLALLFRDTFFPVWDLLVDKGMGFVNDKLGGVFHSMDAFRQSAQDGVDTARDALTKADKLSDAMKDVNVSTDPSTIAETQRKFSDAANAKAERKKVSQAPDMYKTFPTKGRSTEGEGAAIGKSECDQVKTNEKWSKALPGDGEYDQAPQA